MKKTILLVLMSLALSGSLLAQGFYIRAGGTYGLPTATSVLGNQFNYLSTTSANVTKVTASNKAISGSFGAGPDISVAVGYKFNQNFIFDLGGWYLLGNRYTTSNITRYITDVGSNSSDSNVYHSHIKGFFMNPSLIFSAGFGKAAPYGRFGVVFGFPQMNQSESYFYNGDGTTTWDKSWVYKKGVAVGFQAAIGMNWKLSDKIDIYTEVNILNMTWYAKQSDVTKFIENGQNILPNQTVSQKQIDYVKTLDPYATYDATKPTQQLKEGYPLSSVSANVGIRFTLFQKKSE
jgi:hypothetical protein